PAPHDIFGAATRFRTLDNGLEAYRATSRMETRMPLLKLLHLAALLCWCGALLYLPALIAAGTRRSDALFYRDHAHLRRMVFTLVSTPAALLAIGSGTALFLRDAIFECWLIVKLTTVAGMVLCHPWW